VVVFVSLMRDSVSKLGALQMKLRWLARPTPAEIRLPLFVGGILYVRWADDPLFYLNRLLLSSKLEPEPPYVLCYRLRSFRILLVFASLYVW